MVNLDLDDRGYMLFILNVFLSNKDKKFEIQKEYNKKKFYYYKIYKDSVYYKGEYENIYSIEDALIIQQLVPIILDIKNGNSFIPDLLKRILSKMVILMNKNHGTINISMFVYDNYISKKSTETRELTSYDNIVENSEISTEYLSYDLTAKLLNREIYYDDTAKEVIESALKDTRSIFDGGFKDKYKIAEKDINALKANLLISNGMDGNYFNLQTHCISINTDLIYGENTGSLITANLPVSKPKDNSTNFLKIYGMLQIFLMENNLSMHYLLDNIHKKDLDVILSNLAEGYKKYNLTTELEHIYFVFYTLLYNMSKDIKFLRNEYLHKTTENLYSLREESFKEKEKEIELLKKNVSRKYIELDRETVKLSKTVDNLKSKIHDKDLYILELERKLKQVTTLQEEKDLLVAENNELRNVINNTTKQDLKSKPLSTEEKLNILQKTPILMVGGFDSWFNGMVTVFPHMSIIKADDVNFNIHALKKFNGVIVINTNHVSHAVYYRVMKNMNKGTKICYLTNMMNKEIIIKQIYDKITNGLKATT